MPRQSKSDAGYRKVVARAWSDPAFKAELLRHPAKALAEAGYPVPHGKTVHVVEDTESLVHVVLPPAPEGELSEDDLKRVASGMRKIGQVCLSDGV